VNLPESRSSIRRSDALLLALLVALAVLPYLHTLHNFFVYDDVTQILNNPYLQSFHHLKDIFTTPVWSFLGGDYPRNYYRPLMSFGYLLCYQFFGPVPWPFHLVNIVLNALVALVLFFVTWRMFDDRLPAYIAAGLFAIHPIHSESVAWIAAVTDLELAFFFLLTFWFFLGLSKWRGRKLILGHLSMAASFALALLAKEPAVTLPVLATLFEHACREDRHATSTPTKLGRYGPLWFLALGYLAFRIHFVGGMAGRSQFPNMGPDVVFFSALQLAGQYVWKLLWPAKLCAFYAFHMSTSFSDPRVITGAVALAALTLLMVVCWKRARLVSFGLIFFLLNLAPVLYSPWMAANIFTERYLYLPSAGICWGLGWAGAKLWRETACGGFADHPSWRPRVGRPVAVISALIIVFLCTLRIVRRNRDWHDNEVFYKATIAAQPDAYIMRLNLAGVYLNRDDLDDAERELVAADKLAPDYPLILNNLALLNMKRKRYNEAQGYLIRSLLKDSKDPQPHLYLGELYDQIGQTAYAEKEFRTAVMLSPLSVGAHVRLADFYFDHGRLAEAEKEYQESLGVTRTPRGYWGVGLVSWREGRYAEAESAFRQAEALDPHSGRSHIMLGLLYSDTKRNREALEELQTGLKSEPTNLQALEALRKLQAQAP
jgi:hypothetical protein